MCRWGRYCVLAQYKIPRLLYSLAFGGIMPRVSLMFARILANRVDGEAGANPELVKAKQTNKELWSESEAVEDHLANAEARANAAEQRFAAAGDLVTRLFAEEKPQRIPAAAERWPELPSASVAIIAGASPGYVSEVLRSSDGRYPVGLSEHKQHWSR